MKKLIVREEKNTTLADITNASHVGFVWQGEKSYIVGIGYRYKGISTKSLGTSCNSAFGTHEYIWTTVKETISEIDSQWHPTEWYVFDTRKELYQWLAE